MYVTGCKSKVPLQKDYSQSTEKMLNCTVYYLVDEKHLTF